MKHSDVGLLTCAQRRLVFYSFLGLVNLGSIGITAFQAPGFSHGVVDIRMHFWLRCGSFCQAGFANHGKFQSLAYVRHF